MGAIKGRKLSTHACPLCAAFSSKRLTALEKHFNDVHGQTSKSVWDRLNNGPAVCQCGCGAETKWNGWAVSYSRFVDGHNGSIYKSYSREQAEEISRKRSESLRGGSSWCKGLTKETDAKVARRAAATSDGRKEAFKNGDIVAWAKGLTKETDERVARISEILKEKYETGECVPWAKGLTKETDERVASMAEKVSLSLSKKELRIRLDTIKRLDVEEVKRRVESSGSFEIVDGLDDYVNRGSKVIIVKCKTCGDTFNGSINTLWHGKCFKCSPGGSFAQESIAKWIESELGLTVSRNTRKLLPGFELDIYVADKSFAIEYNGLYWHSHINKSSTYHDNKTKLAQNVDISLMHIFEDEWRDKRALTENGIKAALGLLPQVRMPTSVKELSTSERSNFLEKNHLDGDVKASKIFATVDQNGGITCCAALRGNIVVRLCHRIGQTSDEDEKKIIEAVKIHALKEGYRSVKFLIDTRFGGGARSIKLHDLKKCGTNPQTWWWTDMTNRFSHLKYRADSTADEEIAAKAGVVKIWGCENHLFLLPM